MSPKYLCLLVKGVLAVVGYDLVVGIS